MSKALDAWYASLPDFMPADALQEMLEGEAHPEKKVLWLPSDFSKISHVRLGLSELASVEKQLHVGKYRTAGGQGMLTRSEAEIQRASRQVKKWKEVYQCAWRALEQLWGNEVIDKCNISWLQLQPLDNCDCIMLSQWMEEDRFWCAKGEMAEAEAAKRGGGRRELPWIWKMECDLGPTSGGVLGAIEGWTTKVWGAVIRLEWLHAQTSMQQFDEEVHLLTWREQAERQEHEAKLAGRNRFHRKAAAFVHRHVVIFGHLATIVEAHFHEISLK
ncbi:hypothetical protein K439DRAFT_1615179 [Ramaria rubella]|nr:hypothetical protein K439DRAFT_1615179 [Ramaria rubella]